MTDGRVGFCPAPSQDGPTINDAIASLHQASAGQPAPSGSRGPHASEPLPPAEKAVNGYAVPQ